LFGGGSEPPVVSGSAGGSDNLRLKDLICGSALATKGSDLRPGVQERAEALRLEMKGLAAEASLRAEEVSPPRRAQDREDSEK
jgi:hypothetical protein